MQTPRFETIFLVYKEKEFRIEYFDRPGSKGTVLFIHGLGGAKENFLEACRFRPLSEYRLICYDNPGTGNSSYFNDLALDVDDLVNLKHKFITTLNLTKFALVGTSMGGLTALLYLSRFAKTGDVSCFINIEGNLMREDCMFSSKVVLYRKESFVNGVFTKMISQMKQSLNPGYRIISNNLEINTNISAYYDYSFQTVEYSSTGGLLAEFVALKLPKLFIYGEENRGLSYLDELKTFNTEVAEIPRSNHFVFYDNPFELYRSITSFIEKNEYFVTTNQ